MGNIVLYRERDGRVYTIEEPLDSNVDLDMVHRELGLPDYVDFNQRTVRRAAVTIWVSVNSPRLLAGSKVQPKEALNPLLIGGGAIKMLCESANKEGNPFNRTIGDIDFVVNKKDSSKFIQVLLNMSNIVGRAYHYFVTEGDRMFNALRAGTRYRVRAVEGVLNSEAVVKTTDIFVEKMELRHTVKLEDEEFKLANANVYTVGPEKLLLTKAQVITEVDKKDLPQLEASGQAFRILNYPYYKENKLVIGMEQKDMMDLCALLHDRVLDVKSGPRLDPHRVSELLKKDQKFLLTVRLNLQNILDRSDWLRSKGLSENQITRLNEATKSILDSLPNPEKKWDKPWWNTDVETPIIT
ncbi:MAG: hypothetical protein QXH56_01090 [Thermoprotei archaeon]